MSSPQMATASSDPLSKLNLKHLTRWLKSAPEVGADGESLPWFLANPWARHGLDLALFLFVFWMIARTSLATSFILGLPMILTGSTIGFRMQNAVPSLELLRNLPLRPQDIVRGQLLVASRRAALSLVPLLLILWAVHTPQLGGDGRYLYVRDLALAVIIYFAALFFTLCLGLSTNPSRGGLSAHRRRTILCQGCFLLYGHWALESHLASTDGSPASTLTLLNAGFLAALVILCAVTLRTQLRAGLALRDSPIWGDWNQHRDLYLFPALILSFIFLPAESTTTAMVYAVILLLIAQSYQRKPGRLVALHQKLLDGLCFLGLLAAEIALWKQTLTIIETLGTQLFIIVFWFVMQSLGERVARRRTAGAPSMAAPDSVEKVDSSRPVQRPAKPVVRNRPGHLAHFARNDFFRLPVLTGRSTSLLFIASLAALFISPLLLTEDPLLSLVPLAALVIAGMMDRIRRTSIDHPLVSTLPVTRHELGQSLVASTRRLTIPLLIFLFAMQLVFYQGSEATVQGAGLGLVFSSYGLLLGVIWIFSVAISLPVPKNSPNLSKGWKTMTILQILVAFFSLLTLHEMPELSLSYQLVLHGALGANLVWTAGFAWRTQHAALTQGIGMDSRPSPKPQKPGTSIDPDWVFVPFLAIFLFLPENSIGGVGALFSLLALITLVLHQSQTVREAKLESLLFNGFVGFFGLALWIIVKSVVWPVGSDLDHVHANLVLLVAWSIVGTWWEMRTLRRAREAR